MVNENSTQAMKTDIDYKAQLEKKEKEYETLVRAYNLLLQEAAEAYARNLSDRCIQAAQAQSNNK